MESQDLCSGLSVAACSLGVLPRPVKVTNNA